MMKINLSDEAENTIKEIAEIKNITVDQAIERVLENQSYKELRMLKDVQTTIRNIKKRDI